MSMIDTGSGKLEVDRLVGARVELRRLRPRRCTRRFSSSIVSSACGSRAGARSACRTCSSSTAGVLVGGVELAPPAGTRPARARARPTAGTACAFSKCSCEALDLGAQQGRLVGDVAGVLVHRLHVEDDGLVPVLGGGGRSAPAGSCGSWCRRSAASSTTSAPSNTRLARILQLPSSPTASCSGGTLGKIDEADVHRLESDRLQPELAFDDVALP